MNEISDRQEGGVIPPATPFRMCIEVSEEVALREPSQVVQKLLVHEFEQARVSLARKIIEARS